MRPGTGNKASSRDRGKVILSDNAEEAPISGPTRRKLTPEAIDTNIRTDSLSLDPTDATEKGVCEQCFYFPQQSPAPNLRDLR